MEPVWSRDGTELFYRKGGTGEMVAVPVDTSGDFDFGQETVLFPASGYRTFWQHPEYDVSPDGRFIMLRPLSPQDEVSEAPTIQVLNFFSEIRERVGEGG
jgi:hypothetical protein